MHGWDATGSMASGGGTLPNTICRRSLRRHEEGRGARSRTKANIALQAECLAPRHTPRATHLTAQRRKVWRHCERHPELLSEKILCGRFAKVDAHSRAPALSEVPAARNLHSALLDLTVHLGGRHFRRAYEPRERRRRDACIELCSPPAVGKQPASTTAAAATAAVAVAARTFDGFRLNNRSSSSNTDV